jgi:NADP-dependent 3-hydroxy acid dehydrogenase YdfG
MKTVFITGATSGIGMATAKLFAANRDFRLVLCGRRHERLVDLSKHLQLNHSEEIKLLSFDVRSYEECKKAIESLEGPYRDVDVLINNAGLAKGLDFIHEGDLEDWETMIDTNLKGLLYVTRLLSPGMVKRKSGHIINICSTAGKEVYPKGNVYCASKFAVDALTKSMRQDLYSHNIRVSQVAPGHVEETEFALNRFDGDAEKAKIYQDFNPLKSSDVAEAIYWIATRPAHVNIQDILLMGTQQALSGLIDRTGRRFD